MSFKGRVVIVTGAGNGLGKAYAIAFAKRGASVVVNDLGGAFNGEGSNTAAAQLVVEEIKRGGGDAVPNFDSVENGAKIVETAMTAFKRVDVIVCNAGILRDKSFIKMTDQDWDLIHAVHLKGTYSILRAAWPIMREQNYGRIVCVTSAAGLYGNFGQANYSSAKLGIVGLASALAKEGESKNIKVNTIAPLAGSRMTATVMPPDMLEALKPEYVAPVVLTLCAEEQQKTGLVLEVGAGWVASVRRQRSNGKVFSTATMTPETVMASLAEISDFSNPAYPTGPGDSTAACMTAIGINKAKL